MSDVKNFSNDQPINPYYHKEQVDLNKAAIEHENLCQLLINSGVNVTRIPSPDNCQDGVYTANWALIRGDKAVMANLPNARELEESYAKKVLTDLGKEIINIPKQFKFSGQGDALACGNLLFCGSGYRSDKEAQKIAAESLGYERIQLQTIPKLDINSKPIINEASGWPDSYFYDIDLAIAIIKPPTKTEKGLIAYCPEAFMIESQQVLEKLDTVNKIIVSIDEAKNGFATNLISTGEVVIMSAHAPNLTDKLRQQGLKVFTPDITELAKGGGYIRCMTLTLN